MNLYQDRGIGRRRRKRKEKKEKAKNEEKEKKEEKFLRTGGWAEIKGSSKRLEDGVNNLASRM